VTKCACDGAGGGRAGFGQRLYYAQSHAMIYQPPPSNFACCWRGLPSRGGGGELGLVSVCALCVCVCCIVSGMGMGGVRFGGPLGELLSSPRRERPKKKKKGKCEARGTVE
jgi:hypothetical protein